MARKPSIRKRSAGYWQKRSEEAFAASERGYRPAQREIQSIYKNAKKAIVTDIQSLYANYYNAISSDAKFDIAKLNTVTPQGDLAKFRQQVRAQGLDTHINLDNYNARMTRLEAFYAQLDAKMASCAIGETKVHTASHIKTFKDAYYKAGHETMVGLGIGLNFEKIDDRTLDLVLNTKFEGKNYSERIWGNTENLGAKIKNAIATAVATGQSSDKTLRMVRNDFDVHDYYLKRLIRTESAYFHNLGEIQAYIEMGFDKFEFLATLDQRTSQICQHLDGKIFNVKDFKMGENVPPCHPNPYQKGTKIWTEHGWTPVEDLKVGDKCWTISGENEEPHLSPVVRTYHFKEPLIEFKSDRTLLRVSRTHNLWVKRDNSFHFVEAFMASPDDLMYHGDGDFEYIGNMKQAILPKQDCYCVQLADTHTLLTMTEGKIVWCGNCRSTIIPYFEDFPVEERIARDENGKNIYVPAKMKYGEWKKKIEDMEYNMVALQPIMTTPRVKLSTEEIIKKIKVTDEYWSNAMVESEKEFARTFGQNHNIKWIDRFKKGLTPAKPIDFTYDFIWKGQEYELKTPVKLKYSTIASLIRVDARKKGKKRFVINLSGRKLTDKLRKKLSKYNSLNENKIDELLVWAENSKIIKIEQIK